MPHRCFVSFKKEDKYYKNEIVKKLGSEQIKGKVLDRWIESDDIDYIMQVIRQEYLSNTSVTLFLIGKNSSENEGLDYQGYNIQNFIIRELQATLYDGKGNRRSGLLGIVLPEMESSIFKGTYYCGECDSNHNHIKIDDDTVIREFSENYYLKPIDYGCKNVYQENGRFCVLVKYVDFMNDPNKYIDTAFDKTQEDISNYVHWRNIKHNGKMR